MGPECRFFACLQQPRRLIRFSSDDQLHDAINTDCPDGARPVVRRIRQRVCHFVEDGIDFALPLPPAEASAPDASDATASAIGRRS